MAFLPRHIEVGLESTGLHDTNNTKRVRSNNMSKGMDSKKAAKKEPLLTPKEKKAAKKAKKSSKS